MNHVSNSKLPREISQFFNGIVCHLAHYSQIEVKGDFLQAVICFGDVDYSTFADFKIDFLDFLFGGIFPRREVNNLKINVNGYIVLEREIIKRYPTNDFITIIREDGKVKQKRVYKKHTINLLAIRTDLKNFHWEKPKHLDMTAENENLKNDEDAWKAFNAFLSDTDTTTD